MWPFGAAGLVLLIQELDTCYQLGVATLNSYLDWSACEIPSALGIFFIFVSDIDVKGTNLLLSYSLLSACHVSTFCNHFQVWRYAWRFIYLLEIREVGFAVMTCLTDLLFGPAAHNFGSVLHMRIWPYYHAALTSSFPRVHPFTAVRSNQRKLHSLIHAYACQSLLKQKQQRYAAAHVPLRSVCFPLTLGTRKSL